VFVLVAGIAGAGAVDAEPRIEEELMAERHLLGRLRVILRNLELGELRRCRGQLGFRHRLGLGGYLLLGRLGRTAAKDGDTDE
jgi:hypothetical protein